MNTALITPNESKLPTLALPVTLKFPAVDKLPPVIVPFAVKVLEVLTALVVLLKVNALDPAIVPLSLYKI